MSSDPKAYVIGRRSALALLAAAAGGAVAVSAPGGARGGSVDPGADASAIDSPRNSLLWAVAWKETAAEYQALCHQAFNIARMRLDEALRDRPSAAPPLAVISDIDDTIIHAGAYWGELIARDQDFFDDDLWDEMIPRNLVTAAPGALEFTHYAAEQGVEVFYITNRDQGERTFDYALDHLRELAFPFADEEHLTVLRDTSNKEPARRSIAERFEVVLFLGDNLNDFRRDYYLTDIDERLARMEEDRELFGRRFIVLPNPTDGHWVRAIFGDSEPPPTDENRRILREAAMRGRRSAD